MNHAVTRLRDGCGRARGWSSAALLVALLSGWLSACSIGGASKQAISLVTIFPSSGAAATIGQSMLDAVQLAVSQNASLGGGYSLTTTQVDESSVTVGPDAAQAVADPQALGVVGPMGSQAAVEALPGLAQAGAVTVSPTAMLPGLTNADQAKAEGLTFATFHPSSGATTFFRLTADDNAAARAAADLALASTQQHGLGAHAVYVVDDGTFSGKAQSAAFQAELKAKRGAVAGSHSVTLGDDVSVQAAVSAIVGAQPDAVYFAGDLAEAATVRRALTQTGAPNLPLLVASSAADDPAWSESVGNALWSGATTGVLPAQDFSQVKGAQTFESAFKAAYPKDALTPQSALAYDAAMVEISAVKSVIAAGKTPTRAAVLAAVAASKYAGVTGQIAFTASGDLTPAPGFSVYTCDGKGDWTYQESIAGQAGPGS